MGNYPPEGFNELSLYETKSLSAEKDLQDIIASESPSSTLEKRFKKFPFWLKEIVDKKIDIEIKKSFNQIIKNAKPYIFYKDNLPLCISPIKIAKKTKRKESFSVAEFELYEHLIEGEKKEKIERKIAKEIKSREKIFEKLQNDLATAKSSGEFKKKAELILVNLIKIKKGEKILKLKDPYNKNNIIEITMDPAKSPTRNAEEYFKKYRKAVRGKKVIEKRIIETGKEIENLKKLREKINNLCGEELTELEERFVPQKTAKEKKRIEKKEYKTFLTKSGKAVLVGRNRDENEKLTFGFAKPKDLFFHIREAPGSHTILINDGKLSKNDIVEAAKIAAYFSKAKHSTIVPVSYTERRFVRRSKKLGPGKVILTKEKTIFVEPGLPPDKIILF
ncbi:MAG: DUF814 domain-containing protein [Candidatus Cloacimonadota bacterium]|nr:MAG: DUF814 domain-containing protein [Candidatus Cloacimonadota bacterium]